MAYYLQSRLLLLGQFALRVDGERPRVINISSKKARGLIAFLAMQPDHKANREQIATLLWGESSDRNARQALRQCLSVLRSELKAAEADLLLSEGDAIGLRPDSLSIDAVEFLAAANSSEAADIARAVSLYRGEFLSGLDLDPEEFEQWVRTQRTRMVTAAARVIESHARQMDSLEKGRQAIEAVEQLTAIDPLREDWQRLSLEIYARHQGRDAALAHAKSFRVLLAKELGVTPEPATIALVEEIRRGAVGAKPSGIVRNGVSANAALAPQASHLQEHAVAAVPHAVVPTEQTSAKNWRARLAASTRRPLRKVRLMFGYRQRYAVLFGAIAAIAVDSILDAGLGPWYERVFGATSPHAEHVVDLSSQGRPATRFAPDALRLTPQAPLPVLVIAAREEGSADRVIIDSFTDELIERLSRFSDIKVVSRQTANLFLTKAGDVTRLGSELGVPYIVEASLHPYEATTRIDVTLVNASNGLEVWPQRINTPTASLNHDRAEISMRLAAKVHVQLSYAVSNLAGLGEEGKIERLIGKARVAQYSSLSSESAQNALDLYQQALAERPDLVPAIVGVAAQLVTARVHYLRTPQPNLTRAEALLERALQLNPQSETALYWLGQVHAARGHYDTAADCFRRALQINPSFAPAYAHLGHVMLRMGNPTEALRQIRYAMRLSPDGPLERFATRFAGETELELAHDQAALDWFTTTASLTPRSPLIHAALAATYALMKNATRASEEVEKFRELSYPQAITALINNVKAEDAAGRSRLVRGLRAAFADSTNVDEAGAFGLPP